MRDYRWMRGNDTVHAFHKLNLAGHHFQGLLTGDGPTLKCEPLDPRTQRGPGGDVPIGVAALRRVGSLAWREAKGAGGAVLAEEVGPQQQWWVVKYDTERRIMIDGLSALDRKRVSDEFGIPFWQPLGRPRFAELFYASPAFEALRVWVRTHPRSAQVHYRHRSYLPEWYERAVSARRRGGASE